jgi:hypothetical protein
MTRLDNIALLFKFTSRKDDNHDNIDSSQDTGSSTLNAKNLSMQQYTMNNNPCKYDFHYQLKLDDAGS